MTEIVDKFGLLDPALAQREIEAALHPGLDKFSLLDPALLARRVNVVRPGTVSKWGLLDPTRMALEINAGGGGGGTPYTASAVHFDGSTYLTNDSLTAPSDTALLTFVTWFKTTQNVGEATLFVVDPDNAVVPYFDFAGGHLNLETAALPNPASFEVQTADAFNDGQWHCVIFSFDGTSGPPTNYSVYIDDAPASMIVGGDLGTRPFSVLGNGLKVQIGFDDTDAQGYYIGDVADYRIFYGVSILDGTDIPVASRRLFIDANGKPVDPAIATAALGDATIQMTGDATAFATNQGTGGAFTTTGALTDASTSPSGDTPANALTLGGEAFTLGGEILTLGA